MKGIEVEETGVICFQDYKEHRKEDYHMVALNNQQGNWFYHSYVSFEQFNILELN